MINPSICLRSRSYSGVFAELSSRSMQTAEAIFTQVMMFASAIAVILVVMLNKTLDRAMCAAEVFCWSEPLCSAPAASIDYCNSMKDIAWRNTSTVVMRLRRLVIFCLNTGRCNCSAYAAMERIEAILLIRRTWSDPVVY